VKASTKAGLVAAGYAGAFVVAAAAAAIRITLTSGPERDASSGMYAFGDLLFFLAAFFVAAVPATGGALYVLRPLPWFWHALSVTAPVLAITAAAASIEYIVGRGVSDRESLHYFWSNVAVLRLLVAPGFALAFLLAGVFAPGRHARIVLLAATVLEAAAFTVALAVLLSIR
jgi:hypothetical protein